MKWMDWIYQGIFGDELATETERYVRELANAPIRASRKNATDWLQRLAAGPGPKIRLGTTTWGEPVIVPAREILNAHGLVTGSTGSGKTRFALVALHAVIDQLPQNPKLGFGIIDPKGELYDGVLYLLMRRLEDLERTDHEAAKALRRRIHIIDFSARDPITSYNILARWPGADADYFASVRTDLLLDLLRNGDQQVWGVAAMQKTIRLVSAFGLPMQYATEMLRNETLRRLLLARSKDDEVVSYFMRQFAEVPKATVPAICRRLDALFSSDGVRLALSGNTAPDFRRLQDEGCIVLVKCFGQNISRRVRQLLQNLTGCDVIQSVFSRRERDVTFQWVFDEAQNFLVSRVLYELLVDLVTMGRSFGTHALFETQDVETAVPDTRMLKTLYTNIRWACALRGEPSDNQFLRAAIPVTGRREQPQSNPFREKTFYSLTEERAILLNDIAKLPDRSGYLWLKAHGADAINIRTADLPLPPDQELQASTRALRNDPTFGHRVSRKEHLHLIAECCRDWLTEPAGAAGGAGADLEKEYRRRKGKDEQ